MGSCGLQEGNISASMDTPEQTPAEEGQEVMAGLLCGAGTRRWWRGCYAELGPGGGGRAAMRSWGAWFTGGGGRVGQEPLGLQMVWPLRKVL